MGKKLKYSGERGQLRPRGGRGTGGGSEVVGGGGENGRSRGARGPSRGRVTQSY